MKTRGSRIFYARGSFDSLCGYSMSFPPSIVLLPLFTVQAAESQSEGRSSARGQKGLNGKEPEVRAPFNLKVPVNDLTGYLEKIVEKSEDTYLCTECHSISG